MKFYSSILIIALCGCATYKTEPEAKEAAFALVDEVDSNYEHMSPGEKPGQSISIHTSGNKEISRTCLGDQGSTPKDLIGKCFIRTCVREGNNRKCTAEGDENIPKIYERVESENKKVVEGREKKVIGRCLAGSLEACLTWIQGSDFKKEDPIKIICAKKNIFSCDYKAEPLKTDSFLPECKIENQKISCFEGFDGKYWHTVISKLAP